jgi:hypothetical protein
MSDLIRVSGGVVKLDIRIAESEALKLFADLAIGGAKEVPCCGTFYDCLREHTPISQRGR